MLKHEHRRECPWFPDTHEYVSCRDPQTLVSFCDALRACERRVLRKGLWIGWAIGTSLMLIPLVVLVVTR